MEENQNKIKYTDPIQMIAFKMAEGNPDGFYATLQMAVHAPMPGYSALLLCDQAEIYGSQLWSLWNQYGQDLNKISQFLEDFRADKLSREEILQALSPSA